MKKNVELQLPYQTQRIHFLEADESASSSINGTHDLVYLVADANVYKKYRTYVDTIAKQTNASLKIITNVHSKSYIDVERILDDFMELKLTRKSALIIIGGGAMGDLYGFAASIYMRGIAYYYFPTTPMACLDSIIGKVAVDFGDKKNLVGSFSSPQATLICTEFMQTWTSEMKAAGAVELIKHMIITSKFDELASVIPFIEDMTVKNSLRLIAYSLDVKGSFVSNDHNDTLGLHVSLTMGHTIANYLEKFYNLPHGPAVLIGLDHAMFAAGQRLTLTKEHSDAMMNVINYLHQQLGTIKILKQIAIDDMCEQLGHDKINSDDTYRIVGITDGGYELWTYDRKSFEQMSNEWRNSHA